MKFNYGVCIGIGELDRIEAMAKLGFKSVIFGSGGSRQVPEGYDRQSKG